MANKELKKEITLLVEEIIQSATRPTEFPKLPYINRAGYRTAVWLYDTRDEIKKLILRNEYDLDWFNDWTGFVDLIRTYPIYDMRGSDWKGVPEFDQKIKQMEPSRQYVGANWIPHCVGDRVLVRDGSVYTITGFDHTWENARGAICGHYEHYFDIK